MYRINHIQKHVFIALITATAIFSMQGGVNTSQQPIGAVQAEKEPSMGDRATDPKQHDTVVDNTDLHRNIRHADAVKEEINKAKGKWGEGSTEFLAWINKKNNDGWTPINNAADKGHTETVQVLIKAGANVDIPDRKGWTPINNAAWNGHTETVEVLIKAGANFDIPDNNGWIPLNTAADKGHTETVEALIKAGANVDIPDKYGWTPLNIAAEKGHTETVKALIQNGAKVDIPNKYGMTPINTAAEREHFRTAKLLLRFFKRISRI